MISCLARNSESDNHQYLIWYLTPIIANERAVSQVVFNDLDRSVNLYLIKGFGMLA